MESPTTEHKEQKLYNNPNSSFKCKITFSTNIGKDVKTEVFTCRISPDDKIIACGCGDGKIRLLNRATGEHMNFLQCNVYEDGKFTEEPVTSVKWKPHHEQDDEYLIDMSTPKATDPVRYYILNTSSNGTFKQWSMKREKCIWNSSDVRNENQLFTCDYNKSGS